MIFEAFSEAERSGWGRRAGVYGDTTARATTQAIPALLAGARVASGCRVIDVCCGPGYAAGAAAALQAEAVGVDAAHEMIAKALETYPACRFEVGDATSLPAETGSFDAAICSFGLFHLADPASALSEMHRVLVDGGRIAVSQWSEPAVSPFFKVVFGGIGALADMRSVPPAPPPFDLSTADALTNALTSAGFTDVAVAEVPIVFECPADTFMEYFRDFSVRGDMILECQAPETRSRIAQFWHDGFAPFVHDGMLRVPMPARVASGIKP